MIVQFAKKIFGSRNDRLIKRMAKTINEINSLEEKISSLSDQELKGKTEELQEKINQGNSIDDILSEAFAVAREAGKRVLGMRHFDVQLIGGIVLNQGKIAEMRTGEGKTLVATLPAYLNALKKNGVHVVTVNDYLARRDAEWMGRLYSFLGMSTGVVNSSGGLGPDKSSYQFDLGYNGEDGFPNLRPVSRREAYACDITYGTNNEFGFDYLRDNMAFSSDQRSQRRGFAIVDEVDSILIDEARTPLIISGPSEDSSDLYKKINSIPPCLSRQEPITDEDGKPDYGPGDFSVDEKARQAFLSDQGHEKVENLLTEMKLLEEGESLYDPANIMLMHHVMAALRAFSLFHNNVDYIVKDNEVIIVDEFTGRTMPGRRWSEGLHQAVEAKEGVPIQHENQTLASVTFQNYFRLYEKLSGMTGTADTEAYEFQQIYGLEVVVIPTNQPMLRDDQTDLVFLTQSEKFNAIIDDIRDCVERGQPVLVGTASIEVSELVTSLLEKANIKHQLLNAKQHEKEALVVAEAGRPGAVTIATNMAGRGTDIVLGGNAEIEVAQLKNPANSDQIYQDQKIRQKKVLEAGGLRVISTERHESRRIDNQLRGRSGRQGDPGSSRFYLSLEDNLMRIFASEKVSNLMQKLGMQEGEAIEHPWVNKAIENAQRKVEGRNFDIRKNLLEYDDVANDQRQVVYQQRDELMDATDISDTIKNMRIEVLDLMIDSFIPPQSLEEQWDVPGLIEALRESFDLGLPLDRWLADDDQLHEEILREKIFHEFENQYEEKISKISEEQAKQIEKEVMLLTLDSHWKEHLAAMDYLRQGIHLRGYAQQNPKQEYKKEAFEMFTKMLGAIKQEVIEILCKMQLQAPPSMNASQADFSLYNYKHDDYNEMNQINEKNNDNSSLDGDEIINKPFVRSDKKVGRNEPCPCGSGKKYKQCHGKLS